MSFPLSGLGRLAHNAVDFLTGGTSSSSSPGSSSDLDITEIPGFAPVDEEPVTRSLASASSAASAASESPGPATPSSLSLGLTPSFSPLSSSQEEAVTRSFASASAASGSPGPAAPAHPLSAISSPSHSSKKDAVKGDTWVAAQLKISPKLESKESQKKVVELPTPLDRLPLRTPWKLGELVENERAPFAPHVTVQGFFQAIGEIPVKTSKCPLKMESMMTFIEDGDVSIGSLRIRGSMSMEDIIKAGIRVIVLGDVSGSMGGQGILALREGLTTLGNVLDEKDQLGVILYGTYQFPVFNISYMTKENKEKLTKIVSTIATKGGTNIVPAFEVALHATRIANQVGECDKPTVIIPMSDGDDGDKFTEKETSDISVFHSEQGLNTNSVCVTSVGLGESCNPTQLSCLAKQFGGDYMAADFKTLKDKFVAATKKLQCDVVKITSIILKTEGKIKINDSFHSCKAEKLDANTWSLTPSENIPNGLEKDFPFSFTGEGTIRVFVEGRNLISGETVKFEQVFLAKGKKGALSATHKSIFAQRDYKRTMDLVEEALKTQQLGRVVEQIRTVLQGMGPDQFQMMSELVKISNAIEADELQSFNWILEQLQLIDKLDADMKKLDETKANFPIAERNWTKEIENLTKEIDKLSNFLKKEKSDEGRKGLEKEISEIEKARSEVEKEMNHLEARRKLFDDTKKRLKDKKNKTFIQLRAYLKQYDWSEKAFEPIVKLLLTQEYKRIKQAVSLLKSADTNKKYRGFNFLIRQLDKCPPFLQGFLTGPAEKAKELAPAAKPGKKKQPKFDLAVLDPLISGIQFDAMDKALTEYEQSLDEQLQKMVDTEIAKLIGLIRANITIELDKIRKEKVWGKLLPERLKAARTFKVDLASRSKATLKICEMATSLEAMGGFFRGTNKMAENYLLSDIDRDYSLYGSKRTQLIKEATGMEDKAVEIISGYLKVALVRPCSLSAEHIAVSILKYSKKWNKYWVEHAPFKVEADGSFRIDDTQAKDQTERYDNLEALFKKAEATVEKEFEVAEAAKVDEDAYFTDNASYGSWGDLGTAVVEDEKEDNDPPPAPGQPPKRRYVRRSAAGRR